MRYRRTFSVTRFASRGLAISGVLPTCGVMMQFGRLQSGCPSGSGSGSVTSSAAPPIVPCLQGLDEVIGDDVTAAGDVDDPGVVLHHLELVAPEQAVGLRGQRQRQHHHVGAGQGVGEPIGLEHVVDAVHVLGMVADDGDVAVPRLEQADERLGDAAAAEDRDAAVEQVSTGRRATTWSPPRTGRRCADRPGRAASAISATGSA